MNQVQLSKATGMGLDLAAKWLDPLLTVFNRYDVSTPRRKAHFLAQYGHETNGFTQLEENLRYSAERLMVVFPKYFPDLATAKAYELNPLKIANLVYGGRMGNQYEGSGDGYRFRGRGLCHLTGRSNYYAYGQALNVNLLIDPDKLLQPNWAALVGGCFWERNGLNAIADLAGPMEFGKRFFDLQKLSGFESHAMGLAVEAHENSQQLRGSISVVPGLGGPDPATLAEELQDEEDITKRINGGLNGLADRMERFEKAMAVLS